MDNKKTFADLFSSSATNEQISSKDTKITSGSFFEQSSENNEEQKEILEKNEEINLNSILSFNDKNSSIDDKYPKEELDPIQQKESAFQEQEKELEKITSLENLFFEEKKQNDEKATQEELNSMQQKESDSQEQEKNTSLENPFFGERKQTDEKTTQEELNPMQQKESDSQEQEKELEKITSLSNPFFEERKQTDEKTTQEELNSMQQKESDSQEQEKELEKNISLENLFFEEKKQNDEKPTQEELNFMKRKELDSQEQEKNTSLENPFFEEKKEDENHEKDPTSISPFFENDVPKEENPLFLNKINLIENEQHTTKNGSIDSKKSKHFNVKIVKKKESLFKFILGVISYAIFIWLLLIGITLLVYVLDIKIRAAKGDYSSPTFNAYVVLTGSMLPEIQVYDVVITKKVDASNLKEGDIITFASADSRFLNTIITHRILKKNYDAESKSYTFQTKGDNNNVADSALVPQNNIYGKVILKIPKLGYLQEFLASDGGWIIVILIPCLTVISYDIVKLAKGLKRKKYKNIKVQK